MPLEPQLAIAWDCSHMQTIVCNGHIVTSRNILCAVWCHDAVHKYLDNARSCKCVEPSFYEPACAVNIDKDQRSDEPPMHWKDINVVLGQCDRLETSQHRLS